MASCAFGIGFLVDRVTVLSAALDERFAFYVPPAISAIEPSQGPAAGGMLLTVFGRGLQGLEAVAGTLGAPSDQARCRLQLACSATDGPVQVVLTSPASSASGGGAGASQVSHLTCPLPAAPCAGPASFSFALNGVDFVHHLADCPPGGGARRVRSARGSLPSQGLDGCVFEFVGAAGAPLPLAPSAPDAVVGPDVHSVDAVKGDGLSAGGVVAILVGILVYVYLARCATLLAERRRFVRQHNGADAPYSLGEAYVLWLLFGPLGAHRLTCVLDPTEYDFGDMFWVPCPLLNLHSGGSDWPARPSRYYCGQRDSTFLLYACTLGLGGIAWLADGMWTGGLVSTANRRGTTGVLDGVGGDRAKCLNHIELTDLPSGGGENDEEDAEASSAAAAGGGAGSACQAWNALIAKAHSRVQPRPSYGAQPDAMQGGDFPAPASNVGNGAAAGLRGCTGSLSGSAEEARSKAGAGSPLSEALLRSDAEAHDWQLHAPAPPASSTSSAPPAAPGLDTVPASDDSRAGPGDSGAQ